MVHSAFRGYNTRAGTLSNMKSITVIYYLLYAMWAVEADICAEGVEWGEVSFQCSHQNARTNKKYLCKKPCGGKEDILLSVGPGGRSVSERIALKDWGNGVFTVTFSGLQMTDSGKYWCGVERFGVDTYIAVYLTVKEGVANKTTPGPPDSSPTWTSGKMPQNFNPYIFELTYSYDLFNVTALNVTTEGGQSNSTGTLLFTTLPVVVVFTILVLAAWLWKRRKRSKPQSQVCTNSTAPVSAKNREQVDCERNNVCEEMQRVITSPDNLSCTHEPVKDPPTAVITAPEYSDSLHIYENICCSRDAAHRATNGREEDDTCSGIYINPLPSIRSEQADEGLHVKKKANKNMSSKDVTGNPTEGCASKVSACDSTETRPRSLWFGLDLSGTI
ncbi:uncharacterized protein LOC141787109 [Halichoeres trimaculatus]|uniref:uncharacterized protein LOC141787109 n=1 Tax=Halichoeres trimaculatus TaxID=147232 RepID=UPI003D9E49B2